MARCYQCGARITSLSEYFDGIRPDVTAAPGSGRCVSYCTNCAPSRFVYRNMPPVPKRWAPVDKDYTGS